MNKGFLRIDFGILICTLLLLGFGVVLVYSSSFPLAQQRFGGADFFLARQVVRALLGVVCFIVFINIDYHVLCRYSHVLFISALALLVLVLAMPESMAVNGAKRWIHVGFMRFQVSEFARIALIVALARQFEELGDRIREGRVLMQQIFRILLVCGLIVLEPDFSTALLLAVISFALLFVAGASIWHLSGLGLAVIPAVLLAIASTPYRRERILGFLHMSNHKQDIGYQAYQALIGLGNGGLFGVGLGGAERKLFFLPEPHTDFVFSILGEEIGFVGGLIVLGIFAFMLYRGMRIALRAPDKAGQLMAFGITFALGAYVVLHAAVNIGLVPTTGVPLPFLSYGGMSLVFTLSSMGILLNISSQARQREFVPAPRSPD
ncbi:MAG: putative lipid II flippase FtsW, partial [Chitinivibrionales bacterium]|nr:putative lipid II flippase FtsW [Chitinivibrionales bacterium]MBD3394817.1 putative lipid II flippase FtsW [Chitinivibrionales bacterium]